MTLRIRNAKVVGSTPISGTISCDWLRPALEIPHQPAGEVIHV